MAPIAGMRATCRIDITSYLEVKQAAFLEHESQAHHRAAFERLLTGHECFALAAGAPQPAELTEDLFAGLDLLRETSPPSFAL
jgi:hypothetical protein